MRGKMMEKVGLGILLATMLCASGGRMMGAAASSPSAEYESIKKEWETAQEQARKAYRAAQSDEEREKVKYPNPTTFCERFLTLAEKHPDRPAALDALLWVATEYYHHDAGKKALEWLRRDHIQSEKLGPLCDQLIYANSAQEFLRAVAEKNPHRDVQGKAHYALARQLMRSSETEADRLFNVVRKKYGSVKYGDRTLGDAAKGDLYELHHLAIGKVAPEIKGEDVEGKKFKLSDYRGKVVVLDFGGDW